MIRNPYLLRNTIARVPTTHFRQASQVRQFSHISSKKTALGWTQFEDIVKDVKNNVKDISITDQIDRRTTDAVRTLGLINKKMAELDSDSTTATVSFNIGVMQVSFSSTSKKNKQKN